MSMCEISANWLQKTFDILKIGWFIFEKNNVDAWIVTGGTKSGCMEIVGEAVRDYTLQTSGQEKKIISVGIASWGLIANNDKLVSEVNYQTGSSVRIISAS